jgi:hypothetical protein
MNQTLRPPKNLHLYLMRAGEVAFLALSSLVFLSTTRASAQVTCDAQAGTQPGNRPSFPWQNHFIDLTRLGNHWMPNFGDGDSMTNPFWLDQGTSFPYGSAGFQETWYIPRSNLVNTAPLYRLYSPGNVDHMDWTAGVSGYTTEFTHGYPWTYQAPGTLPISRYLKSSIFDHRTWLNSQIPSRYAVDAIMSTANGLPRYGFERFGNLLDQCSVINMGNAIGTKLQNSKLRVGFDPLWGNAISEMTQLATTKQVVSHSIGEMVQSVLWYAGPAGGPLLNPTQSGGADCWDYGATRRWAGSPVISSSVSGIDPTTLTTTVRPLNFCHDDFQGNDVWTPLAWQGLFRLTTTLGCRLQGTLYDDVIQIQHEVEKDATAPFTDNPINMNNTGWLLASTFGDCRSDNIGARARIDVIDLPTGGILSTYYPRCNDPTTVLSSPTNKGLRISSADGTFALGFARVGTATQLDFVVGCSFDCRPATQRIVVDYHQFHNITSTTWEKEQIYYVLASPAEVLSRLPQIYADDGNCLN